MKSPQENILLVGFMGTGKSSLGRLVAKRTGRRFVDTDHLVVQREGREIAEIFSDKGEEYFREVESSVLAALAPSSGLVIATGGGIVTIPKNLPLLKRLGLVVWLQASDDEIFRRVSRNSKRPLLRTENPRQTISELLAQRAPFYAAASDFALNTTCLSHKAAAEALISEASRPNSVHSKA